jgi:hypothetical protein
VNRGRDRSAIAARLAVGAFSFTLLPWYFSGDAGFLDSLAGAWTLGDGAAGVVHASRAGRPWLWSAPTAGQILIDGRDVTGL